MSCSSAPAAPPHLCNGVIVVARQEVVGRNSEIMNVECSDSARLTVMAPCMLAVVICHRSEMWQVLQTQELDVSAGTTCDQGRPFSLSRLWKTSRAQDLGFFIGGWRDLWDYSNRSLQVCFGGSSGSSPGGSTDLHWLSECVSPFRGEWKT